MTMATSPKFPDEVWLCIADELSLLPDILHLSLSCTRLRDICAERLRNVQEQLRLKYWSVNDQTEKVNGFPWHALLLKILRGEVVPSYLVELDGGLKCMALADGAGVCRYYPQMTPDLSMDEEQRIRRAVNSSPWIYADEVQEFCRKTSLGDEDAVFCILVPLLTNLRYFVPPINTVLLPVVIGRIAAVSAKQLGEASSLGKGPGQCVAETIPLGKLLMVATCAENGDDYGISLEDIAPFTALPSVRRMLLKCVRDETFCGWPVDLPLSRMPEVYFADSSVTAIAVREFAKGFEGPCIMRQDWGYNGETCFGGDADLEWDHYEIAGEIDTGTGRILEGSRRDTMETKHEREDHEYMANFRYGHNTYKRLSECSDGMNAFFDGSLDDWKALAPK